MAKRRPYHVVPNKQNGSTKWKVKREGASRAYSSHTKKSAAVKNAKRVGDRQNVGAIVHRRDGTVQYGWRCSTSGSR